ncbi:MAG: extracellular solute-binding protein [Anaerolineales bacterium]|nr:extracellular solute-binding protein [Anaerolineales bacterium]
MMKPCRKCLLPFLLVCILLASCTPSPQLPEVVIYTSVDQVYSESILKAFEKQSSIKVRAVYDVEATKTTGLVNRLIAEKSNPQADVFWSGEFVQTIKLKEQGVLQSYAGSSLESIPPEYRDREGYWVAFGGRARILLVSTESLQPSQYPDSIFDLLDEKYAANQVAVANPLFGTTATHAAALYALLGAENAYQFFEALKQRGVQVVDGNSVVRDKVVSGELIFGLTDTDDACAAIQKGASVQIVVPDQGVDAIGTLIIPNTVALIAGASHPEPAKQLMEYLLSVEIEKQLLQTGWINFSLRHTDIELPCPLPDDIKGMDVEYSQIYAALEKSQTALRELFLR